MLNEYDFEDIAGEFGVAVGTATFLASEESKEGTPKTKRRVSDDTIVNEIILDSIDWDDYRDLRLDVLRMEKSVRKGTKELTIYKRVLEEDDEEGN